jgi:hypothetical protein
MQTKEILDAVILDVKQGKHSNVAHLLPLFFKLRGKPFSIKDHFVWEPLFNINIPQVRTVKCGRQIGKSETTAVQMLTYTKLKEYFNLLYIAPLFEQTRVFSCEKIAPFIKNSPIFKRRDPTLPMNITHRVAYGENNMYFSYAQADAERIRSKTTEANFYDEVQDIDPLVLYVASETMSASKNFGASQHTGTPKTFDNLLEAQWGLSSQAEWCIPCTCGKLNVACADYDLIEMLQPHGLSCASCGKLINTRLGWWEHRFPNRRALHEGYHAPQAIFPVHCEHQPGEDKNKPCRKWVDLVSKMESWPQSKFYNEKLGESFDSADELISKRALIENSTLDHNNDYEKAVTLSRNKKKYTFVSMGVDWGGGGESGLSRTAIVVLGFKSRGTPDVLYIHRLVNPLPISDEAKLIKKIAHDFGVNILADDFCGAGSTKEIILLQSGFPPEKLMPVAYISSASKKLMSASTAEADATPHIKVPKGKSLAIMAALINQGYYTFPKFDSWDKDGYPDNLLALVHEKRDRLAGGAAYIVTHKANRPDDVAHALNYATLAYWFISGNTPDLTKLLADGD